MRALRLLGFSLIILGIIISTITFQGCEPDCDIEPECDTCVTVYKPNIYIYPIENIQLLVNLDFPLGGEVITSIPDYGNGWNVLVDTNGLIDNYYNYLFYESKQPDVWQKNNGWIIQQTDLESFFTENMTKYGFYGAEIQDFIEYWIPRLNDFEYYEIYPQTSEIIIDVIRLNFSTSPDNLLRLFYVVKGFDNLPTHTLIAPIIDTTFKRENYFVTEWGVILN